MKLKGNKKIYYIVALIILIVIVMSFLAGRKYPSPTYIDKIVKERIEQINAVKDERIRELEQRVQNLTQELIYSKLKYRRLNDKIKEITKKEDEIVAPKTNEEIKKRLRALGYSIP